MAFIEDLTINKLRVSKVEPASSSFNQWGFVYAQQFLAANGASTTTLVTPGDLGGPTVALAGAINPTVMSYGSVNAATAKRIVKCSLPGTSANGNVVATFGANTATGDIFNVATVGKVGAFAPKYDIFAAGVLATGTSATPAATITGALATDIPLVMKKSTAGTARLLDSVVMTANTMTLTLAAAATVTHDYYYMILRPAGNFIPSHKIVYAGYSAFDPDAASGTITITGARAGDICIATLNVNGGTNELLYAALTANTLTITCAGDPGTAGVSYIVARPA